MSHPTVLGPWYVVQRLVVLPDGATAEAWEKMKTDTIEYYTAMEDGDRSWQSNKKLALLFMSLHSAARVRESEVAEIRVLTTREEANEFGRGE